MEIFQDLYEKNKQYIEARLHEEMRNKVSFAEIENDFQVVHSHHGFHQSHPVFQIYGNKIISDPDQKKSRKKVLLFHMKLTNYQDDIEIVERLLKFCQCVEQIHLIQKFSESNQKMQEVPKLAQKIVYELLSSRR